MSVVQDRAKSSYLTVYLTVVSMIEAIALENLVARASELSNGDFLVGLGAAGVLQCLLVFVTIVYMWVAYATFHTVARWTLGAQDFLGPFLLGTFQLLAITLISTEASTEFFALAGIGFLVAPFVNYATVTSGKADPDARDEVAEYPEIPVRALMAGAGLVCLVALAAKEVSWLVVGMLAAATLAVVLLLVLQLQWWSRCTTSEAAA